MTAAAWLQLGAGLLLLVMGAEALVRGATSLARSVGISPLVVGLTVVAFGTSTPEVAVSVQSALNGQADIALGNVLGSNIFNVLLILGLSAVVTPLLVSQQLVRFDVPVMVCVSFALWALAADGLVGRIEGIVLVLAGVVYVAVLVRLGLGNGASAGSGPPGTEGVSVPGTGEPEPDLEAVPAVPEPGRRRFALDVAWVLGGVSVLVLGARWVVSGAEAVARAFGVSELVVGLTVVAAGTSLPELATSLLAGLRGERDIAVGNVVGSNILNILWVLGIAAGVSAGGVPVAPAALSFDLPMVVVTAVACLPIFFTGFRISRWEGAVFLAYYAVYVAFLFLTAAQHEAAPVVRSVVFLFVVPISVLTLVLIAFRQWHRDGD